MSIEKHFGILRNLNENNKVFIDLHKTQMDSESKFSVNFMKNKELKKALLLEINKLLKPLVELGDVNFFGSRYKQDCRHQLYMRYFYLFDNGNLVLSVNKKISFEDELLLFIRKIVFDNKTECVYVDFFNSKFSPNGPFKCSFGTESSCGICLKSALDLPNFISAYTKWVKQNIKRL